MKRNSTRSYQVRSAHTTSFNLHENVIVSKLGKRNLYNREVLRLGVPGCNLVSMKLGPTRSLSEVDSSLHLRPSSEILKKKYLCTCSTATC